SLFSYPGETANISFLCCSDCVAQLRSFGGYRSVKQLFEGSLLLVRIGLRKPGGYFKLELLSLRAPILRTIVSPPDAQQTSDRSETSGQSLAGTQVGAFRPDQGENGRDDADANDDADKSIPKGINIIRRPVSLQEPEIKGQRYLKTHIRDPIVAGGDPCRQAMHAKYSKEECFKSL